MNFETSIIISSKLSLLTKFLSVVCLEITTDMVITLLPLLLEFSGDISSGHYADLWSFFASNGQFISTNQLLGGAPETITDAKCKFLNQRS